MGSILFMLALVVADPTEVQLYKMPPGMPCLVGEDEFRCYGLTGYKKLIEVDSLLRTEEGKNTEMVEIASAQAKMLNEKNAVITSLSDDIVIYKERSDRLHADWKVCLDESTQFPWDSVMIGTFSGIAAGAVSAVVAWYLFASR